MTAGDPTEGFGLDPTGFANVRFQAGRLNGIPAPGAYLLGALGLGLVGYLRRRFAL